MSLRHSWDFTYVSTLALDVEVGFLCITAVRLLKNVMSCFYRTELENRAKPWPCEVSCERPLTSKLVQKPLLSMWQLTHFMLETRPFLWNSAELRHICCKTGQPHVKTYFEDMISNDFMLVCNSTRWLRHLSFFQGLRHFWWSYNMQRE